MGSVKVNATVGHDVASGGYVGRFDGSNAVHASPAMAALAGNNTPGSATAAEEMLPTSTKWSVLSSRVEGLVAELGQIVGKQDAYCVAMSEKAEGPAMKAVREKMLSTPWAAEYEAKKTMFSYGEEMSTDPLEAVLLKELVFMAAPRRVLEVGMFVGYGSVAMLEGSPSVQVVSLDIDPYLKNWLADCLRDAKQAELMTRHEVMVGPALESLPKLQGEFDMVFIDANKAEYKRYVEVILERGLLAQGGVIVCDNILYNGYPYMSKHWDAQPARRGFGDAIREFNQWVAVHPLLEQVVLPIRDGVSLVRRKGDVPHRDAMAGAVPASATAKSGAEKTGEKGHVLHFCGSCTSEYYKGVSMYYAAECLKSAREKGTFENSVAMVDLDGRWSFPADLSEEAVAQAPKMEAGDALRVISTQLKPDAIVPHMYCLSGMTTYRALFDLLGLPMVGCTADVMALSTNKAQSRAVVQAAGVRVPKGELLRKGDRPTLAPPFILKPCKEDNSMGVSLVGKGGKAVTDKEIDEALEEAFKFDDEVLCEEFIPLGREIRVGVVERPDGSLQMLECLEYFFDPDHPVRLAHDKLNTDSKGVPIGLTSGGRKCPADIDDTLRAKLKDLAFRSHKAFGCRDYSLYDVRICPKGEPYFLEACLYCSFAPRSVIVSMSEQTGMPHPQVFEELVGRAKARGLAEQDQRAAKASGAQVFGMKAKAAAAHTEAPASKRAKTSE